MAAKTDISQPRAFIQHAPAHALIDYARQRRGDDRLPLLVDWIEHERAVRAAGKVNLLAYATSILRTALTMHLDAAPRDA